MFKHSLTLPNVSLPGHREPGCKVTLMSSHDMASSDQELYFSLFMVASELVDGQVPSKRLLNYVLLKEYGDSYPFIKEIVHTWAGVIITF